ncbi:AAA family ATPase [Laceyella putida]|uniref:Nuclease SbcCD subunit C n=1 Tax=Laceyella putida TaxID=110101 RepID=A0ABW2RLE8_9BACL
MSTFKRLVIENFQSHQHTTIDFSDGLNVFVGPSDSGKSAILRAIRWVLFNVPRGSDYIRSGAKECRVSLTFADGTEVVRVRSSSINRYILRKPGEEERVFEGFGNTVPQEIVDVHRIEPIKLDQKELYVHFGTQLESPFLLFESNQNKAKTIGRISGAHLIDNALKKASSDRQQMNAEIKRLEQTRDEINEKLQPYENIAELEEQVARAEEAYLKAIQKQELCERLSKAQEQLGLVSKAKAGTEQFIASLRQLPQVEKLVHRLEQQKYHYRLLTRYHEQWGRLQIEKTKVKRIIEASASLPQLEAGLVSLKQHHVMLARYVESKRKWDEHHAERIRVEKRLQALAQVRDADLVVGRLQKQVNRVAKLEQLQRKWTLIRQESGQWKKTLERNRHARAVWQETLPALSEKKERLKRLTDLHKQWADVTARVKIGTEFCRDKKEEIKQLTQKLADEMKKLGNCPMCKRPIEEHDMEHLIHEYLGG